ncbi:hypothetical protein ACQP2Y_07310 [Actinoplanes sp. CA-051413]|uniref:hypothetical protein n=1 Tax=Actinoplanes sp. CA-051413 TaxID=3239899 RepID=UPI003D95FCF8
MAVSVRHSTSATSAVGDREAWRRSQFAHRLRSHRRISRDLDRVCGVALAAPADVAHLKVRELREILRRLEAEERAADSADYWAEVGFTLGVAERIAAGRELAASVIPPSQRRSQDVRGTA